MDKEFAVYTKRILKQLPYWFKMKKDPSNSIGAQFLNAVGLELDQVEYILTYAYDQTNLLKIDNDFLDVVYKAIIPDAFTPDKDIRVYCTDIEMKLIDNVNNFFISANENMIHPELYYDDPCYIDFEKHILYVKKPYDATLKATYGKITIEAGNLKYTFNLNLHPVWNFFDEFGMLLSCPRLHGERNAEYKSRILDVFENKANASRSGLANGIARELCLRKERVWENRAVNFEITDPMVIINEIKIDGEKVPTERVYITSQNTIVLQGDDTLMDTISTVSYISGLEMHQLHNKEDYHLQRQLFNVDNTATDLLKYYTDRIHSAVPIMWGQFHWDEGYWDTADEKMNGIAFIPNLMDAKISGFLKYNKQ